jgi:hypothetical protein
VSIALLALIALAAFAVLISFVRFLTGRERKALVARAQAFACTGCGRALGEEGVELADTLWERHMQRLFESGPVRSRIVRNLDAVCPQCGKRYQLDAKGSAFTRVEVALSFEAK